MRLYTIIFCIFGCYLVAADHSNLTIILCPDGYRHFRQTDICFKLVRADADVSALEARRACIRSHDGVLSSVHGLAENDFVLELAREMGIDSFWLGGYVDAKVGGWKWYDDSQNDFENNWTDQPRNGTEKAYLYMLSGKAASFFGDWAIGDDRARLPAFLCRTPSMTKLFQVSIVYNH
ncbi:unnamed protein product, partial [Mesorhabditis belari]|uniref:C-type lectin domain-containing protein n=1 Tax=Mesorhabditis belari TaxID=2138241 RepID=A0AAF3EFJ0_9BILA